MAEAPLDHWLRRALESEERLRLELSRTEILCLLWRATPEEGRRKVSPLRCMLEEAVYADWQLAERIGADVYRKLLTEGSMHTPEASDG